MKRDLSILRDVHRGNFGIISMNIDSLDKSEEMVWAPIVGCDDRPHEITSFFWKTTYCIQLSVGIKLSTSLTWETLFNKGDRLNLEDKDLLPKGWKEPN